MNHLMLKSMLATGVIILSLIVVYFYVFQRQLIYFPNQNTPHLYQYEAQDMQKLTLRTKDNILLTSWYKAAGKGAPTLLYFHGNSGHIGHRMPLVRQFLHQDWGILLLEYRGYGGNKGLPSETGLYEDARAAIKYLYKKGIKPHQLVLYGESLGTAVATEIARENRVCALILQSPFTSLTSLARYHYPYIFFKPWDKFNSLERMKEISSPLLILHGTRDSVVPYKEAKALFKEAKEPKKMHTIYYAGHNNLWNTPFFSQRIIHFVQQYCGH